MKTLVAGIVAGLFLASAARADDADRINEIVSDTAALLHVYKACADLDSKTETWLAQLIQRSDLNVVVPRVRLYADMLARGGNWRNTCSQYARMLYARQRELKEGIYK